MPTLDMDEYEAGNLLWLLRVARHTQLDTGDWCGQLRHKLEAMGDLGQANHDDHESFAAELRARRAADLSAEEVEALEFVRGCMRATEIYKEGKNRAMSDRALALLDRLLST